MTAVRVKLLHGGHTTPDGVRHRPADPDPTFVESRRTYEAFKDKFELLEATDDPAPKRVVPLPSNATPDALELIKTRKVDWAHIKGSGKDGRIRERDVLEFLGLGKTGLDTEQHVSELERQNAELRASLDELRASLDKLQASELSGRAAAEVTTADTPTVDAPNATRSAVKYAELNSLDLATVKGTGRGGQITLGDAKAAKG
jgi:pyruvate/2-oxoglutarate dehydrogenase complex dihydrolipoamide acyltransferase (E2) component